MRYQGRITTWKDDQGFGFITPNGGGDPVFLHIKTFSNRQRRPVGNEIVTYELTTDERRRPRAVNVAFVGERRGERSTAGSGWGSTAFVTLFFAFVAGTIFTGKLPLEVLGVYFAASLLAFIAPIRQRVRVRSVDTSSPSRVTAACSALRAR
jgi:cold shock CspA family protein